MLNATQKEKGNKEKGKERRHEKGEAKKRRWQCLREQTSPPVWLPDSKEQTGGEGRRTSGAVCLCARRCTQRWDIFPAERRASVRLCLTRTIASGSCLCLSECHTIKRYTWPVSKRRSGTPSCICPAACYPHAICQSACLLSCLSIYKAKLHVPIAVSTLSVYLPTCLPMMHS